MSFRKSDVSKTTGHAERKPVKENRIRTSSQEMQKTAIVWLNGLTNPQTLERRNADSQMLEEGVQCRDQNIKNEGRKEQSPAGNVDITPNSYARRRIFFPVRITVYSSQH